MRLLAALVLFTSACATSVGSHHAPRVLPKGQFEATLGTGALVPVGVLAELASTGVDAAKQIAATQAGTDRQVAVDADTAERAAIASAALVVSPPAAITDLTVRYGLFERVELGLRLSGPAVRGEAHAQLYAGEWNVLAGLGVGRHAFGSPLLDLLEKLSIASFTRTDVDFTLLAGREWEYGSLSIGPKAVLSRFHAEGLLVNDDKVVVPNADGTAGPEVLDLGSSLLVGGLVGGRVGWKYAWFTAELGVYHAAFTPVVLGKARNLGGLVVFPTLGFVFRY